MILTKSSRIRILRGGERVKACKSPAKWLISIGLKVPIPTQYRSKEKTMIKSNSLDIENLANEINSFRDQFPKLAPDNLFVLWFLRAFVTDDLMLASRALTGQKGDKGLDAIFIDDKADMVFIVQGKFREKINGKTENRNDILSFANISSIITGENEGYNNYINTLNPSARELIQEARKKIINKKYSIRLIYATLAKCGKELEKEAIECVKSLDVDAAFEVFTGDKILHLLSDYLEGVAPPIPSVVLDIESGSGVRLSGILQRFDSKTEIESWVFPMSGKAIAEIFERHGIRIFARNVRGFLGDTDINLSMQDTIENSPEFFWYYNNGITIICDLAEKRSSKGKESLYVQNPQIINGQQTTRTLSKMGENASKASVLVRIIQVPRSSSNDKNKFNNLVSNIVSATNWQNAIRPSDLMANDTKQIELERELRKVGYLYLRKRQSKSEIKGIAGANNYYTLTKEELAQSVAACDLDPYYLRQGKENLFEERTYNTIFPSTDVKYYLDRYWVVKKSSKVASGYPERGYAKWLVINFIWNQIQNTLSIPINSKAFHIACKSNGIPLDYFNKMATEVYKVALLFYRKKAGKLETAIDVSSFFRKKNLNKEFFDYWNAKENNHKSKFDKHKLAFVNKLEQASEK